MSALTISWQRHSPAVLQQLAVVEGPRCLEHNTENVVIRRIVTFNDFHAWVPHRSMVFRPQRSCHVLCRGTPHSKTLDSDDLRRVRIIERPEGPELLVHEAVHLVPILIVTRNSLRTPVCDAHHGMQKFLGVIGETCDGRRIWRWHHSCSMGAVVLETLKPSESLPHSTSLIQCLCPRRNVTAEIHLERHGDLETCHTVCTCDLWAAKKETAPRNLYLKFPRGAIVEGVHDHRLTTPSVPQRDLPTPQEGFALPKEKRYFRDPPNCLLVRHVHVP
mmetsp:Transcript_54554/g.145651  ORF Transcript_54554/g.145651 Transcript_54554/m.145651 type:complete len:275 (-) Transcript_54554:1329-2153(-)